MAEQDTVKLLRECSAGIKMGTESIENLLQGVESPVMRRRLEECRAEHEELARETEAQLRSCHDRGKEPGPVAKTMSRLKCGIKLTGDHTDAAVADIITDSCCMAVKTLCRYLNQYGAAGREARDIARRLIASEERLIEEMRPFL